MMLGRIAAASRFAAAGPLRARPTLALWASPVGGAGSARSFAAVSSPRPISIRMDSLFVKCMIAAIVYFVPQDAVFLTGLFAYWHNQAATAVPKQKAADAEGALEEWKAKKGLDSVSVYKGSRTWYATLK